MTTLVKAYQGALIKYPATLEDADVGAPEGFVTALPRSPSEEMLASWNLYPLHHTPRPEGDKVKQGTPVLQDGKWVQTWVVESLTADEIEAQREKYSRAVDLAAETARKQYVAAGEWQAQTYVEKAAQARAVALDDNPTPEDYPLVEARATARGVGLLAAAGEIITAESEVRAMLIEIERRRESAKAAIAAASTGMEIRAAAQVDWTITA